MRTNSPHRLPTQFAPAERLSAEEIAAQLAHLGSRDSLKRLMDTMPSLVALLNHDRQILLGNAAMEKLAASLHGPAFDGLRLGEFMACQHAASAPHGCGTTEACRTCGAIRAQLGALRGQRTADECRIGTIGGHALDFRVTASPFEWAGHDYVIVVLEDIGDEKRRQLLERVFFHDVLNTAGSVSGIAAILADEPALTYDLKDDLLLSAETLVNEIKSQRLLLAAESGELVCLRAPVIADDALKSVRQLYRNHPAASGRQVEIESGASRFVLSTDPAILQRVLANMLKNALEACRSGDVVWMGVDVTPSTCTFWCQNPGEIPREAALQIFQRSFSTKGPGRGIGTYSIKLFGERYLGGKVSFATSREEGTRFQLSLPIM